MQYPDFLKQGDAIGVTAPSDGNKKDVDIVRLENGKKKLEELGYAVIETENVRKSEKGRSSDGQTRAKELELLILNKQVKAIIAAKGGDYLMEMLSLLDFNKIKTNPKWLQGYSDVTGLLFITTTICDLATIYGNNFNDFGMEDWHEAIENNIQILQGKPIIQHSFPAYQNDFQDRVTGLESYVLDQPVEWKNVGNLSEQWIEGRLIGGCLDVLLNLVGTRFDHVKEFIEKYKEDKILWFLESFDLNSESLSRGLWQLKEAGWFEHASGFVFGRPAMYQTYTETSYVEAVWSVLDEFHLPIILDADIGHKAPQFTVINGAKASISCKNGKGKFSFSLV